MRLNSAKRFFLWTAVAGAALFFIATFVLILYGGGVPYHDGPNAGYMTEPGVGRWLELHYDWAAIPGVGFAFVGTVGLLTVGSVNYARTRKARYEALKRRESPPLAQSGALMRPPPTTPED